MRIYVLFVIFIAVIGLNIVASAPDKSAVTRKDVGDVRGGGRTLSRNSVDRPPKGKGRKNGRKNKCKAELISSSPDKACHSEAVRKCGRNFISKLRKRQGPDGKVPYKDKCLLRETFLNCLSDSRKKPCRPRGHVVKDSHREEMKRVTAHLWSTRGCLLGIDA